MGFHELREALPKATPPKSVATSTAITAPSCWSFGAKLLQWFRVTPEVTPQEILKQLGLEPIGEPFLCREAVAGRS